MSENIVPTDSVAVAARTEAPRKRAMSALTSTVATTPSRTVRLKPKAADVAATATASPRQPRKSTLVLKLLARTKGATIAEMVEPTGWQPHSTRAFLSGLRKKGMAITREQRRTGETAYRTGLAAGIAASAVATSLGEDATPTFADDASLIGSGETAAEPANSADASADVTPVPEAVA